MAIPGAPPVLGQLINGHAYSFSSIELMVGAESYTNLQSISYNDALEPGELRGTSSKKVARTRGEYTAEGSFEIYKGDLASLLGILAAQGQGGYAEAVFDISANYNEGVSALTTDALLGCRIVNIEDDHSTGTDALTVTVTLNIMEITRNGLSATSGGPSGAGIGAAIGGVLGGSL